MLHYITHIVLFSGRSPPSIHSLYKKVMLNPNSKVNVHQDLPITSQKHKKRKDILIEQFFDLLKSTEDLSELSNEVPLDPDIPEIKTKQFYLLLQGDLSEKKYKLLDECMHRFCDTHRRKTKFKNPSGLVSEFDFDYQPSTFDTDLKTIFGIFKSNGVNYTLKDFEKNGGFLAKLYSRWRDIATVREDFGALPFQADFDMEMDQKLSSAIETKALDYKHNYRHFMMLIIQLLGKSSMLRGAQEVSEV